jgi:hypothetical protein
MLPAQMFEDGGSGLAAHDCAPVRREKRMFSAIIGKDRIGLNNDAGCA